MTADEMSGDAQELNNRTESNRLQNQNIINELGILQDGSNRIGLKHLDQTLTHIRAKTPIQRGKLVNQLRIILLVGARYVEEYIDGLNDLDVIRIEKGIVYWNYDGNKGDDHGD